MSAWELTNIAAQLVLPPGGLILLGLAGLALVGTRRRRLGTTLAFFALLSLYALSIPAVSTNLVRTLESSYAEPAANPAAGAIVVLGGGLASYAPEYGFETVSGATLARVRYAAHLQRRTGRPILVTGGNPTRQGRASEAEHMTDALREFGAAVRWTESTSNNTFENARLSAAILKEAGVRSVYLVTHAWHMPRARGAFEREGLEVIPAATAYKPRPRLTLISFIPSAGAIADSAHFFHEILGMAWYRLKSAVA